MTAVTPAQYRATAVLRCGFSGGFGLGFGGDFFVCFWFGLVWLGLVVLVFLVVFFWRGDVSWHFCHKGLQSFCY